MSGERIPIQAVNTLQMLMFKHYMDAKSAGANGQKVAWVTSGAPVELLHAAGVVPVYPENHAALCGAQKLGVQYCNAAEERGFSRDLCSYARTDLGCIYAEDSPVGGLPKPDMLFCCNNICGTVTKWYQQLQREFGCPLVYIDTPFQHAEINEHAVQYVTAQLEDAIKQIASVTGKPFDMDRLYQTALLSAEATRLWRETLDLCAHRPSPMTSFDAFIHIAPIVTMRGTQECCDYYTLLSTEMKQRVADNISAVAEEKFRLGWDNIPIWFKLAALSKRLAQHGACLVVATYTDAWAIQIQAKDPAQLLPELARVYTEVYINCGTATRTKVITDMVDKYHLDGMLLHSNRSCKAYSFGQFDIAQNLQEQYGIPSLVIEGDMNDSRTYSDEQINTRIDAFMEALAAKSK
ncbi:MAG: hypothetical protein QG656_1440 [Candidatus Hydrogenedentes bacterium]|nr:hypothetical protein [Candidatus Hydrogenedentota bacterium]